MTVRSRRVVARPGDDDWRPTLLTVPTGVRRVARDGLPVLLRQWRPSALGLLVAFLLLQFLIPARLVISGMGAVGRPSVAVGVLLAFLWFLSAVRPHQLPGGRQPIRWVVGLYVAVQLLGNAIGFDRGPSELEASSADRWLILTVAMAGVTLAVADGIRSRQQLDRLLRVLVALSAVMAFTGILQFFRIVDVTQYIRIPGLRLNSTLIPVGERGDMMLARVAGTASHYIEFGVVLSLVLPIAIHYALFAAPGRAKRWQWFLAGMIAFAIPLSISRSATLTVAVTFILLAVVWPWRQKYNALVIAMVSVVAFRAINPGVLGTIRALFTNVENDPSVQDRIARTAYVMDVWNLRPWFGRGSGMVVPETYILLDNQIYVTLLAGGVVGVAILLMYFCVPYFLGRSIRLRGVDQETRHLGQALAVTMPAALLSAGTFDAFSFTTWVAVMSVLIGAVGALWRLDGTNVHRPLQLARPEDTYVASPVGARVRERVRAAWTETSAMSWPRAVRRTADGTAPGAPGD